jgi:hypothetical protein
MRRQKEDRRAFLRANPLPAIDALKAIVNFAQLPDLQQATPEQLRRIERSVQRFINRESPGHWRYEGGTPDWKALEVLRAKAHSMLNGYVDVGIALTGDLGTLNLVLSRHHDTHVTGDVQHRLPFQIWRVLDAVGRDRLLKCPGCGKLFVKVTKKTYCSTRCYGTTYMKAYRKKRRK